MTDVQQQQPGAPATPPAAPTNSLEARGRLNTLIADKDWGAKLLAGDAATAREYRDLSALADGPVSDQVSLAMSDADLGFMPNSSDVQMRNMAGWLREAGFDERCVRETLEGKAASDGDIAIATRWKKDLLHPGGEWSTRLLKGDPQALLLYKAAIVILNSPRKADAA